MTSIVKHAENANKARRELAAVKEVASVCITEMQAMIKAMYVFGGRGIESVEVDGRRLDKLVPELIAAESATEIAALFEKPSNTRS